MQKPPNSPGPSPSSPMANFLSYLRIPFLASSGIAALGSSLLYFKQNDIIYPSGLPAGSRTQVPVPRQFGITDAESLKFPTIDGETLHAYLIRPPNTQLRKNITILTFHGNAGNIGHRLPIAKVLSESLGCHVFMLEYRGYGHSSGSPDEKGLTIDAQTALEYIRQNQELKDTKIVVYGQSLGGAVAIKLVAANLEADDIAGLILENTFLSIRKLVPTVLPPAKYVAWLCHQQWNSEETIQKLTSKGPPVLFLSGLQDEIVPPFMMKSLHDLCKAPKIWKEFRAGDHNSTVAEPAYFDEIWSFLVQEVLKAPISERKNLFSRQSTDVLPEELWS